MILRLVKQGYERLEAQWTEREVQERLKLINRREPHLRKLTDEELRGKTDDLRTRVQGRRES
jgi:preprotein translocase subunit SecA